MMDRCTFMMDGYTFMMDRCTFMDLWTKQKQPFTAIIKLGRARTCFNITQIVFT